MSCTASTCHSRQLVPTGEMSKFHMNTNSAEVDRQCTRLCAYVTANFKCVFLRLKLSTLGMFSVQSLWLCVRYVHNFYTVGKINTSSFHWCSIFFDIRLISLEHVTYMHSIVYYESKYGMPDCLNYESTLTQISYILLKLANVRP